MKIYALKNNYSTMPAFLNYKIIKSNVYLEKFFVLKVLENKEADVDDNHTKIMNHLSRNFDRYIVQHSINSTHLLKKLQMMMFYNLSPPQASIWKNHDPVLEKPEYEIYYNTINNCRDQSDKREQYKDDSDGIKDKTSNYMRFYENPFECRLKKKPDIFPNQNLRIDVVKSI